MPTQSHAHFTLAPLNKTFGVIINNVDITQLDGPGFDALYQAWLEYALLIIPKQTLTDAQQEAFARRFGPLVKGLAAVEISNVLPNGKLRTAPDDDMMKIIRGNMHWHQDSTYMPIQAKGAVFSAKQIPPEKGDTAFADMRAAYDALDQETKDTIAPLSAYHSLARSQAQLGEKTKERDSEYMGYGMHVKDTPLRPLVKIHPETGGKSLALGRHAFGIPGLSESESGELIAKLIGFAVQEPRRVYQHRWTVGDVLIWDNRCLMHRACDWDYAHPRVMLHSRIDGDPVSESQAN